MIKPKFQIKVEVREEPDDVTRLNNCLSWSGPTTTAPTRLTTIAHKG